MKHLKNYSKWGNKEENIESLKCSFNPKEGRKTEEKKQRIDGTNEKQIARW